MSRGEKKIKEYLKSINIDFEREKTFPELRGYNNGLLRFDFCININEDEQDFLFVEFDGEQHFEKVQWSSKDTDDIINTRFELTQRHDRIKNRFCKVYDYPLLRNRYDEIKDIDDLLDKFLNDPRGYVYSRLTPLERWKLLNCK